MQRVLGIVLLAAALLTALVAPTSAAPRVMSRTAAQTTYSRDAVHATNVARVRHDRATLNRSSCLAQKAWAQAHRMARQRRIFHQDLGPVLRDCHLTYAGENVAFGYRTGTAVVFQGWMRSPDHRANILSRHYRLIAVGAVRGGDGRWYVSQVFGRHR